MVMLIVNREEDPGNGRLQLVVSHGIDMETDEVVVMPPVHPRETGAMFDMRLGEWVLPN